MSNGGLKFLNTCACVDSMDKITTRVIVRLVHEYGICILKREMVPTLGSICLKTVIANLNSLRGMDDVAAYVNLFDIVTLGLVELNFEETEKATNILPDFRIGKKGCEISGMNYDKYLKDQVPINSYRGRVVDVEGLESLLNKTWSEFVMAMNTAIYNNMGFQIDDVRITSVFLEIFLEEVFYDLGKHKGEKDYSYKLYDLLYFNTTTDPELWGTDVMPEYKLMVKNDSFLEDTVQEMIEQEHGTMDSAHHKYNDIQSKPNGLYYN